VPRTPRLPGAAEVERALAEVYARPELSPPQPSPLRVWLGELWSALREWLSGMLPGFQLGEGELRVLSWLVIAVLVIVAVVVLVHLAEASAGSWRSREWVSEAGSGKREEAPTSAEGWEEAARRAAAAGRWREAALALYQGLLRRLEARGTLRYDAAKTPGDYRRELRTDPALAGTFEAFLRRFEPVAFGARPLDASGYDRLQALAAQAGARG
jgi:hypothetical protein